MSNDYEIVYRVHQHYCHVLCKKFRNGSTNDMDDMEESDRARFEFDPSFGLISCIATVPDVRQCIHLNRSCLLDNYIA